MKMLSKEEAKEKLKQLVQEFKDGERYWDSKPEEDIKHQFIEPLFEDILGWDRKDISKEQRVLKGRADYILKNGNQEVLVIEAKKTNIHLTDDEGRQAVSYAYHRKIKFSVLTNFKYIYVYHALSNIKNISKNLLKVNNEYFRLGFEEFIEKFDILWLLSKESFENGEINKLLSSKDEKLNKPIDVTILNDLLNIRSWLSKDLKSKKNYLSQEIIDEIVQIMIDRLIFIRSVEDRGLEPMNYLRSLESDVREQRTKLQLFYYILEKFEEFNQKYDSKLFEKGLLEKEGNFSDDSLRKTILALYFGSEGNQERYLFDQIPGDLFGSIYEQYLGTILAGTEKRVTLDSDSGKRKKMGIYYTPSYIVDYIVKNTVHEYIKDKTIDEILNVKILDPACGSGSFITRAFVEVCNTIKEKLNEGKEGSKLLFKNSKNKIEELSLGQKIEILKSCIYGVDLDEKAVEIARLNLLLKLLDGETQESRKLLLPHLENNIKCGNSLIDDTKVSDRAFKWEVEFKEVMNSGGFDVVIGNPPYVDYSNIKGVEWINNNYGSARVNDKIVKYNLFQLFIEKSIKLLKEKGLFGFINPNTYLSADNAFSLRKIILNETIIKQIIDVSKLPIFKEASTYPVITIFEKGKNKNDKLNTLRVINENQFGNNFKFSQIPQINFEEDAKLNFVIGGDNNSKELFNKLEKNKPLSEFKETFVWGSSITGFATHKAMNKEKDNKYSPVIQTSDIKKYFIDWDKEYIEKSIYSEKLKDLFKQKKLVIARVTKNIQATIDSEEYFVGKSSILIPTDKKLFEIFLAILNSKLINFYYKSKFETTHMAGGYLRFDIPYLSNLPIRLPSPSQEKKIVSLVEQMLELQKKYHADKTVGNEKDRLKQQIDNVNYEIDQEVYKLYELTPEEIKIVEGSLK